MALQGVEGTPTCMICLDKEDPYHHVVCSVDGCGGTPVYMAVMERGDNSPALLCQRHLDEGEDHVMSYLGVPSWLLDLDTFHADDSESMLDWEVEEEGVAPLFNVTSDSSH